MFLKDGIQLCSCGLALPSLLDVTFVADEFSLRWRGYSVSLTSHSLLSPLLEFATLDAMAPHGSNDSVWPTTTTTGLSGWKSPGLQ